SDLDRRMPAGNAGAIEVLDPRLPIDADCRASRMDGRAGTGVQNLAIEPDGILRSLYPSTVVVVDTGTAGTRRLPLHRSVQAHSPYRARIVEYRPGGQFDSLGEYLPAGDGERRSGNNWLERIVRAWFDGRGRRRRRRRRGLDVRPATTASRQAERHCDAQCKTSSPRSLDPHRTSPACVTHSRRFGIMLATRRKCAAARDDRHGLTIAPRRRETPSTMSVHAMCATPSRRTICG